VVQVPHQQVALMGEEQLMHFPERGLVCGGLGCFGGELCVGMDVAERAAKERSRGHA
jgi:hypothetical protein